MKSLARLLRFLLKEKRRVQTRDVPKTRSLLDTASIVPNLFEVLTLAVARRLPYPYLTHGGSTRSR